MAGTHRRDQAGGFKVCFNQGINTRMLDYESAAALASIPLYDDSFTRRRPYTAWDNIGDEKRFFDGVNTLEGQYFATSQRRSQMRSPSTEVLRLHHARPTDPSRASGRKKCRRPQRSAPLVTAFSIVA
jgi:hypothetical protein